MLQEIRRRRDAYIRKTVQQIEEFMKKNKKASINIRTSDAPNGDIEQHIYMPHVAEHLKGKGYSVTSEGSGVVNWVIQSA